MLDHFGLSWLNDLMLHAVMQPAAAAGLFGDECAGVTGSEVLDWRHGYVVGYSSEEVRAAEHCTPGAAIE